jgi:putative oxidoreductase
MKYLPAIAGVLLGALFAFASLAYFFNLMGDQPPPPKDSAMEHFFIAFGTTGYLTFVKTLELIGAVLVAIPATRRLGLLILGPIVVNIIATHVLIMGGGMANPLFIAVVVLPLYLVWAERHAFLAYLRGGAQPA